MEIFSACHQNVPPWVSRRPSVLMHPQQCQRIRTLSAHIRTSLVCEGNLHVMSSRWLTVDIFSYAHWGHMDARTKCTYE